MAPHFALLSYVAFHVLFTRCTLAMVFQATVYTLSDGARFRGLKGLGQQRSGAHPPNYFPNIINNSFHSSFFLIIGLCFFIFKNNNIIMYVKSAIIGKGKKKQQKYVKKNVVYTLLVGI